MTKTARRVEKLAEELVEELVRLVVQEHIEGLLELATGKREAGKRGPGRPRKSEAQPEPKVAAAKVLKKGGRRRSAEVKGLVERVVEVAREKGGKEGVSAREIAEELGVGVRELTRPVQKGLEEKRLRKKGERQFTRYIAVG
jgi:DNA invertase Pin-like site-specific DNA recombinase